MELKFLLNFLKIDKCYDYNINYNVDIIIDSRIIKKNDIFIGIKGKNFDGSLYAQDALNKGALFAIVDNKAYVNVNNIFYVEDSIKFLGDLASAWRDEVNPIVFGITGSSGKTTIKEIVSVILKNAYSSEEVLTTYGNFNNHIGLPLTLLSLTRGNKYAVIEMGMNHFGEMKYLSKITKPDYALISNIQSAHIGCGFETLESIAKAKAEIFIALQGRKTAVLPKDDKQYENLKNFANKFRQISFGIHAGDVMAFDIKLNPLFSFFQVNYFYDKINIFLPIPGLHNISNTLASIAMIKDLRIESDIIINSLKNFQAVDGRLKILKLSNGITLINDTYNSNPESMKSAIDVLAKFNTQKIVVMGDMGELGNHSLTYHFEIGKYILNKSINVALFIGSFAKESCQAFGRNGIYFQDQDSLVDYLVANIKSDSTILIKGSRFMNMENIIYKLQNRFKMG